MNKESWESDKRVQLRGGFAFPFAMVAVSLYWMFFNTPKFNELSFFRGEIDYIVDAPTMTLRLKKNDIRFSVYLQTTNTDF